MGLELAAMAVGQGVKTYLAQQAQRGIDKATRAGIAQQAADRAKANAVTNGVIGNIATQTPAQDTAAINGDFMDTLRANSGRIAATTPTVNGADSRYEQLVANDQNAARQHTNTNAGYIAALMGAQRMRQNQNFAIQDAGTQVGEIQNVAGQDDFLTQLRQKQAGVISPYAELGANLLTNLGGSGVLTPRPTMNGLDSGPTQFNTGGVAGGTYASSPTGNTPWNPWATTH